jgi:ribosomal protein L24E
MADNTCEQCGTTVPGRGWVMVDMKGIRHLFCGRKHNETWVVAHPEALTP